MNFTNRQTEIIKVSIDIIAEKGIQNLTTKNLAKEIGISEPALYRHFKNKSEILRSVIDYFSFKMKPAIEKLNRSAKALDKIEKFISEHLRIISSNPDFAKVIFSEANFQNEEELILKMNNMMSQSHKALGSVIRYGQNNNEISNDLDSLNIVRMIIGSMRLLVTQWSMSGMIFNLELEGKQLSADIEKLMKKR